MAKKSKNKKFKAENRKIFSPSHARGFIREHFKNQVNRERLSPKRENIYFTPYKRASAKIETTARFNPVQNRVKIPSFDLVRNDGYLTRGTFLDKIAFRNPFRQSVCVKRAQRRRVIFALNLLGKGSGAKKHKFTLTSGISCKG